MKDVIQFGKAHSECAKEVQIIGDRDNESECQNGGGCTFRGFYETRTFGRLVKPDHVEPDRTAEKICNHTQAQHREAREGSVADIEYAPSTRNPPPIIEASGAIVARHKVAFATRGQISIAPVTTTTARIRPLCIRAFT